MKSQKELSVSQFVCLSVCLSVNLWFIELHAQLKMYTMHPVGSFTKLCQKRRILFIGEGDSLDRLDVNDLPCCTPKV